MRISTRYLPGLLALLALALVPVVVQSYAGRQDEDCGDVAQLLDTGRIPGGEPIGPVDERGITVAQFAQGRLRDRQPGLPVLGYQVLRSFEPLRLALKPTRGLVNSILFLPPELRWIEADGERLPVHVTTDPSSTEVRFASYLLVYQSRPVVSLLGAQLRSAVPQIVGGTRPLTILLAGGSAPGYRLEESLRVSERWLAAAWRHHRDACGH